MCADKPRTLHVILVDDNPDDLEIIKMNLLRLTDDIQLEGALSTREALTKIHDTCFDCIICDYQMPGLDGLELLQALRNQEITIPFIFLTGQGNEDVAAEALRLGADDYFVKEIGAASYNRLLNCIQKNIEAYQQRIAHERAALALRESEAKYRSLFEGSKDVAYITTVGGKLVDINQSGVELFGYGRDELSSIKVDSLYADPSERDKFKRSIQQVSYVKDYPVDLKKKDGTIIHALITSAVLSDENGKMSWYHGIIRDVTESRRAEEALRRSEASLAEAQRIAHLGNWDWDIIRDDLHWSDEIYRIFGLQPQEFGATYEAFLASVHPDDKEFVISSVNKTLFEKEPFSIDHRIVLPDGAVRIVHEQAEATFDKDGRAIKMLGTVQDITERQIAQEALRESEARYRTLFESTADGILIADVESKQFKYANPAISSMLGYSEKELRKMKVIDIHPSDSIERVISDFEKMAAGKTVVTDEIPLLRKDGTIVYADITASKTSIDGKECLLGFFRDITESKQAEEALRESEEHFRSVFENISIGLYRTTPDGRFLLANPALVRMLGYDSLDELTAFNLEDNEDYWPAYSRSQFRERIERDGEIMGLETTWKKRDGSIIFIRESARAVCGEEGEVLYYEGTIEDISERKMLEIQLAQALKLEAIGQLAAGIAHEINTPTQYVGDNTRFLQDAFSDLSMLQAKYETLLQAVIRGAATDDIVREVEAAAEEVGLEYLSGEIPKAIQQSLEGVDRVAKIVRAMKDFSHPGKEEKTAIDLNRAIESTITIARNEWKYVADMVTDFDRELPLVHCLPNEFNQVVLNIILNAAQAIGDVVGDGSNAKGTIKVSTCHDGEWAEIRISDTGSGIPEDDKPRVFDPFFTTKEIGKGTGQGLTISHDVIVKKHGGTITFETDVGRGTTFLIRLPIEPDTSSERDL